MNWTKPALSALSPITRVRIGSSDASRAAPMTDPVRLPIPPRMTMAKMVSEMENPNRLGVASCRNADRRPPASAASADVMANTLSLNRNTLLPSDCTACGSSRMPRSTRP